MKETTERTWERARVVGKEEEESEMAVIEVEGIGGGKRSEKMRMKRRRIIERKKWQKRRNMVQMG